MLMAKESLMEDIDMHRAEIRAARNKTEELRIELCDKINASVSVRKGLDSLTTVLDI